jgi:thiosulfate dehydrogenase [quinone] large subunit
MLRADSAIKGSWPDGEDVNNSVGVRTRDVALAYLLLRATIGLNIFIHGASRILAGVSSFANSLVPMFQKTLLPAWSVHWFGLALPWVETILGFLVLAGLRTRFALIGGSVFIFVLTFGSTLRQDWESAGLQLIYASIYAALLAFRDKNVYSLDALLHGDDDEKQR